MQTYDLILNEAYRLFARNGFEKTSLSRRYLSRDGNSHVSISNKAMPPNLLYMFSATSSAILVILLCIYLAESKYARGIVQALIETGQMTLTHYVMYVIVGLGILEIFGILENGSLTFSMLYALAYFVVAIVFSLIWKRKFKRGPLELVMRKF